VRTHGTNARKVAGVVALVLLLGPLVLAACSSGGGSNAGGPTTDPASPRTTPLRVSASKHGFLVGAAVAGDFLQRDKQYRRTLASEYNAVTPENAMKWATIHPEEGRYDFAPADAIVRFARAHQMAVRGHNLVWYREVPSWVTDRLWTRAQLEQVLHDHIRTVVDHYRGKIAQWDVVNEAVDHAGKLRDSVWLDVIGPDYIDLAFRWAHKEDPHAKLYYNDYDIESPGPKARGVTALVKGLRSRGVPIDGVGIQAHELAVHPPSGREMEGALRSYASLGLDVAITELDVGLSLPADGKKRDAQAQIYGDVLHACLVVSRCHTFVTWGFTDASSWIPDEIKGSGDGLPFDRNYQPKPALTTLRSTLARARG
jgi:endo-1,4-beta-xylanase